MSLQECGKNRTAKRFYIRSIALKQPPGWRRFLVEGILTLYYAATDMPPLRKPQGHRHGEADRRRWVRDQEAIRALVTI
jgi:hypothetical protein